MASTNDDAPLLRTPLFEAARDAGGRMVRDQLSTGETLNSNQVVVGGNRKILDGRATLRVDGEFNINGSGTGGQTSSLSQP